MRLFLSSMNLGDEPERLTALLGSNRHAAIIMNAADFHNGKDRAERYERELASLREIGITGDELDLREYFDKEADLARVLEKYGLVWLRGGNAFILRRAMRQSGFDTIIKDMLGRDAIVYAGYSAGACVATPTLKGLELVDAPDVAPEEYKPEVVWEGLGLVGYSIAPHYRSPLHPETEAINDVVDYFKRNDMPYRALIDGQVITLNRA